MSLSVIYTRAALGVTAPLITASRSYHRWAAGNHGQGGPRSGAQCHHQQRLYVPSKEDHH